MPSSQAGTRPFLGRLEADARRLQLLMSHLGHSVLELPNRYSGFLPGSKMSLATQDLQFRPAIQLWLLTAGFGLLMAYS